MASLVCKPSVRFKAFTPALLRLLRGVYHVACDTVDPPEIVITSANDSTHGTGSRHYTDEALDLRVHSFATEAARLRFAQALRNELGPAFTVLYESAGTPNAHLHLQVRKSHTYTDGDLRRDEAARR